MDKRLYDFEQYKTEFETKLYTNYGHVIAKIYKLLLKYQREQVKECLIKWAKMFGYNIQMVQWENMWLKEFKFILFSVPKENFYKMICL